MGRSPVFLTSTVASLRPLFASISLSLSKYSPGCILSSYLEAFSLDAVGVHEYTFLTRGGWRFLSLLDPLEGIETVLDRGWSPAWCHQGTLPRLAPRKSFRPPPPLRPRG